MRRIRLLVFFVASCSSTVAIAQCATTLASAGLVPEATGNVHAVQAFDPDGAGAEPLWLFAGGDNLFAGEESARALIAHDGARWRSSALPVSAPGAVHALTVWNGELVAAGEFTFATTAGPVAHNIARFDGTTWQPLGTGTTGTVRALAVFNGELVAAGSFTSTGGVAGTLGVARWNGATWAGFGAGWTGFGGVADPGVRALAVFQGSLYAGGSFQAQGPLPSPRHLARWNGTSWLVSGDPDQPVNGLAVRTHLTATNARLFATGAFTVIGGVAAARVAAMDGFSAWSALAAGVPGEGRALLVRATGSFTFELLAAADNGVQRWNGTAWTVLIGAANWRWLGIHGGQYLLGGGDPLVLMPFTSTATTRILGQGIAGEVRDIAFVGDDLVVVGPLGMVDGQLVGGIARRSGGAWSPLGTGLSGSVRAVVVLANGDVVAGGSFSTAGGVAADNVARWNGSTWSAMGAGLDGEVHDLVVMPNGDVIAAGSFQHSGGNLVRGVARLVGSAWQAMPGLTGPITGVAAMPNGDVVACGVLDAAGTGTCGVARWTGSAWGQLGASFDSLPFAVAAELNGNVVVGGSFTTIGGLLARRVARWNGLSWQGVGSGQFTSGAWVLALAVLPAGGLLAGGSFTLQSGDPGNCLARFDGQTWSDVGGGCDAVVYVAKVRASGEVFLGGDFRRAGGAAAGRLATYSTNCPAAVAVHGAGCVGSSGAMTATATVLPWTGDTFRAVSGPFTPTTLAVAVFGFQPLNTPLQAVLPQAFPGCTLLAAPDSLAVHVPTGFTVATQLAIPPIPSLAGVQCWHQVVALEFNAAFALTGVASTNALAMTVGSF